MHWRGTALRRPIVRPSLKRTMPSRQPGRRFGRADHVPNPLPVESSPDASVVSLPPALALLLMAATPYLLLETLKILETRPVPGRRAGFRGFQGF